MNKMKEVAELLGVQLGERFKIKDSIREFYFDEYGLKNDDGIICPMTLTNLLNGEYEIIKPILDEVEKKYLENVLRPFKERINFILLRPSIFDYDYEQICVDITSFSKDRETDTILFPLFEKGKMYKGMEVGKHYTLKELGLFDEK